MQSTRRGSFSVHRSEKTPGSKYSSTSDLSPRGHLERQAEFHMHAKYSNAQVPCTWVDATHPSYTLYTSGTTGVPKGVQRDTGGYAVALAASMRHIFLGQPGETYFSTSDIGWVGGHSYIIYGPLPASGGAWSRSTR